ncbi:MAG: ATP synthase F0 subunit B [Candidatus Harrisonbacteria bacterium CG10_big_fil_rev_8_21_14_0_10_38_8]|uniref:ATP synthase subunit b n=1 Tax=Candidatus Harrisonbacteria bacterium CG10_big_fil_rev_8_21_14_0_10_38_8 TaxID=1974582 RepID=A0A2M6WJR2_9BACT|nr:MAG: ATP synthase F0 subunit B [Candidatus Harrisonbacteria bacterium CG10_big_fil_rev_8_21_14_0_10_38_8]
MEQFIHEFGVDIRLLIAQLINFVVLVFVLAKFVYKPIIKVLDERRKKIEDGLEFSQKAKSELDNIEQIKAESIKSAEQKTLVILKEAEGSARELKNDILLSAEVEKEKLILAGKELLKEQKRRQEKEFYAEAASAVQSALGIVLGKKEFVKEEQALINEALNEIK